MDRSISHRKKCEDCQLKGPSCGLPAEGKARWCGGCAKGHAGAVAVVSKKCEGCQLKGPSFGLRQPWHAAAHGEGRWCSGCAKGQAGAVNVVSKKCEGCQLKGPSFGLPAEGRIKWRWCAGCAPKAATSAFRLQQAALLDAAGGIKKKRKATGPPLTISEL